MAILEPYRKQEIIKTLVDKALAKLNALGVHKCRIQVDPAYQPQPFWETVGWSEDPQAQMDTQPQLQQESAPT